MQCKLTQYVVKRDMKFMTVQESTGEKINSFRKVYELMKPEAAIDRECVWVLHLNSHLELIEKELVSMGDVSASIVHPRKFSRRRSYTQAVKLWWCITTQAVMFCHQMKTRMLPKGSTKPARSSVSRSRTSW